MKPQLRKNRLITAATPQLGRTTNGRNSFPSRTAQSITYTGEQKYGIRKVYQIKMAWSADEAEAYAAEVTALGYNPETPLVGTDNDGNYSYSAAKGKYYVTINNLDDRSIYMIQIADDYE